MTREEHRQHPDELADIEKWLRSRRPWCTLSPEQSRFVLSLMSRETYEAGKYLSRKEDGANAFGLWAVVSGQIEGGSDEKVLGDQDLLRLSDYIKTGKTNPTVTNSIRAKTRVVAWHMFGADFYTQLMVREHSVCLLKTS